MLDCKYLFESFASGKIQDSVTRLGTMSFYWKFLYDAIREANAELSEIREEYKSKIRDMSIVYSNVNLPNSTENLSECYKIRTLMRKWNAEHKAAYAIEHPTQDCVNYW